MSAPALVCALDTADRGELAALAAAVGPEVDLLKVGLQAYTAYGPAAVEVAAAHAPVFADLKLHDIPNTVAGAAAALAGLPVAMLTVHASGGREMIAAAVQALPDTVVLGVTVLTSLDAAALAAVGQPDPEQQVSRLARLAVEAGAGGVVCGAPEVATVRDAIGLDPLVVVPGVRPAGSGMDDQARSGLPAEALDAGATHVVVGRPITQASDPAAAARAIRSTFGKGRKA